MTEATEIPEPDTSVQIPDGPKLVGHAPIVLIGPNGSGKTRQARQLQASCSVEFVNPLRNTGIRATVPVMSYTDAESNFSGHRNQARTNYWDLSNEFEYLLASLLAEHASTAIEFRDKFQAGQQMAESNDAFQTIRDLWEEVFPGRKLVIPDYRPMIRSKISGEEAEYAAQTMSDGERAAIYLAGRVLRAEPGILVVDEPETHLHSRLASRFWDELETRRPDVRFVYITHDLTFARSRRGATYVMASPLEGLKAVDIAEGLSDDVAEILLGTASLSFYARRVVFCEGREGSRDAAFYSAWFSDRDTVVRAVGASDMVHRCMSALQGGWLVGNVQAVGIIDRDFHSDEYLDALPDGLCSLPFHEVESLYCLPGVVSAVAEHLKRQFDEPDYVARLRNSVSNAERQKVILERWKRRVEPRLIGVVAGVQAREDSLDAIAASLPQTFAASSWDFAPEALLDVEKVRVEEAATVGPVEDLLRVLPGKGQVATAAQYLGMDLDLYINLVNESLKSVDLREGLGARVEEALADFLPPRLIR